MKVAFFDLDRTLLDCNSGRLWLVYEWKEGRLRTSELLTGAWWLLKYSLGNHDLTEAYASAVAKLAGERESVIAERTRLWFETQVAHRIRPGAAAVLEEHRSRGDKVMLATSSSPYIAACAIELLDLDGGISAEYGVSDGLFTGDVISLALGEAKADRVVEWAEEQGIRLDDCYFYTDSMTDRALLEGVGHPVVVNPDRPLAKLAYQKGWPVQDWGRHEK